MRPFISHRLLSMVALGGLLLGAGCQRQAAQQDGGAEPLLTPVAAAAATTGALRATLHVSGVIVPAEGAEFLVVAPQPARVLEITKAEGDKVVSGELLVRFELPSVTQELARQQADVARVRAQVENVRIAHARVRDLVDRQLLPRRDLEAAERELADAQTLMTQTEASGRNAEQAAALATVRAPFSGVLAQRLHNPGDVVQAAATDPVVRLVDPARLEVLATIPGRDASRVVPGASGRVSGFAGGTLRLSVSSQPIVTQPAGAGAVNGSVNTASGSDTSVRLRLTILDPTTLMVDTPVEIDIDAEARNGVVFVPADAVVGSGSDRAVFIAAGPTAERRLVTIGAADDQRVEILSGVRAGELVVTRGQTGLVHGAAISVILDP